MKILDRYILITYLKTFISVFVILVLIFILQTIWLYIKELAGKDLDVLVIAKFLFYFIPKLIPLVLPLTILLASIMVFGSFAENYEFAAMKSTGISLQRAMSGLSIFVVLLAIVTFFFSNNVIPWAELNSYNLRRNIAKLKPAMLLAEGQFNEVGTYNIKFSNKSGDNDQYLKNVIIHIKGENGRTNATSIISKTGELASEKDSNVLKLILRDGYYYSDVTPKKRKNRNKHPFIKSVFEKKEINIDLSQLNNVDFDEKSQTDKYNMLDISGLSKSLDSLTSKTKTNYLNFAKNLHRRSSLISVTKSTDSVVKNAVNTGDILTVFDTKKKLEVIESAARMLSSSQQLISTKKKALKISQENINRHLISLHEKFALGFACIILFFVGAPLGALIRKGGIGLPMVIAILLFLTYHFIGIFATNSAKKGGFNPILASWFSTLIMLPLGVFLTIRATADKGLFDFDSLLVPLKKAFHFKSKQVVDYTFLASYKNEKLIHLINHYEELGYSHPHRFEAFDILRSRGMSVADLRLEGLIIKDSYDASENILKNLYQSRSKSTLIWYGVGLVLLLLYFVFKNNKLPHLAVASISLSLVSLTLFIIYYIKSLLHISRYYQQIQRKNDRPRALLVVLGIPLYPVIYVFLKIKIKQALQRNLLDSLK